MQHIQNEEISDTKWENVKKEVLKFASEVECQIKMEERNRAQIIMLNRRMRMNTKNYKNK